MEIARSLHEEQFKAVGLDQITKSTCQGLLQCPCLRGRGVDQIQIAGLSQKPEFSLVEVELLSDGTHLLSCQWANNVRLKGKEGKVVEEPLVNIQSAYIQEML